MCGRKDQCGQMAYKQEGEFAMILRNPTQSYAIEAMLSIYIVNIYVLLQIAMTFAI